jgi:hypothetical protein
VSGVDAEEQHQAEDPAALAEVGASSLLTDTEKRVLDFERQRWKYAGAKVSAIRVEFDMSETRYYQVLNALLDRPEALAHDPAVVRRLQRIRQARQQQRAPRESG